MKKLTILLSVLLLVGLVSLTYAQQKPQVPAAQAKAFTGTLTKITPGDPAKEIPTEIVAIGADQIEMTFQLGKKASLVGADGKPTTLDKLKAGDKVEIEYTPLAGGANVARSIKVTA